MSIGLSKNDFISNQLSLDTGIFTVFASKTHFRNGSSRFVLLLSRATICCSKSALDVPFATAVYRFILNFFLIC